jgi:hypothetical protein
VSKDRSPFEKEAFCFLVTLFFSHTLSSVTKNLLKMVRGTA